MTEVDYLTLEDLLLFTKLLGAGPVRDVGLLESAVARPRTSLFGEDAYVSVEAKAAALLHSICKNHALVDGNRRLALLATITFLRMNGRRAEFSQDEAFELVISVAEGRADIAGIADVLAQGDAP
ncbi:type II toxin-antitoxin system death-on-curing family toxin [Nocardioides sp. DS6]|uniref:Type II toxin-antitoxin system death-on-curing family toxin n=1 Tax=Nocardioides eburneus TaxID=3231482 RepID=A0ABV3T174_9ACTN